MSARFLTIDRLSRAFHTRERTVQALADISFHVDRGEFLTIIGPTGSGKSTLFNILAGLLEPDTGSMVFEDDRPARSHVAYMPQRDLLLPWRRVVDNAALPLEIAGVPRAQARERVTGELPAFGLEEFAEAFPSELSGGMRQRAALLRTVMIGRPALLLDEPFGSLDAITRREMQDWLLSLHRRLGRTVLFITHDVDEAVYLADRVIVLSRRPGRITRELAVPLPRPRGQHMTGTSEFGEVVAELLEELGLSHRAPERDA
jgi:ABC-type nitrate/sulfonate/bicarbonate transport system ATPase subunit